MKRIIGIALILIFALGGVIFYNARNTAAQQETAPVGEFGMFEWEEKTFRDLDSIKRLSEELHLTRWYQEMPQSLGDEKINDFVRGLHESGLQVYGLIGAVEWGYEKSGKSLIKEIKKVVDYNQRVSSEEKIVGLMLDIEPYTSSKWEKSKEKNMRTYVQIMTKAYQYAKKENLRIALCIPRHYDDQGLTEQLEQLIAGACDEVAVMDYDCGQEIIKIATEAAFTKKYGKELHCILEFQEVGKHGLTEDKTYRTKGIAAAQETWELMKIAYPDQDIICDYHWSKPVLEIIEEKHP